MGNLAFIFITIIFLFFFEYSYAADTITISQSVADYRNQTLVSKDGSFELGFFSPGTSRNRFVGIWYKVDPTTVVWVANRQNPINGSSGILMISNTTGNLVLVSDSKAVVWSSNLTTTAKNPTVQLLDSGNLVIKDEEARTYLWQSFDYPTDTYLPGMKLGWDSKTGLNRRLSAWKNPDDPSPGDFTYGIELYDYPEAVMWKGSQKYYRNGPWNGYGSSGSAPVKENQMYEASFVSNKEAVYFVFNLKKKSVLLRTVLNQTLYSCQYYAWNPPTKSWRLYSSLPNDNCDQTYNLCGSYGNCIITESPVCQCLKAFKPKSPENWNSAVWSQGCVRNNSLNCQNGDGFVKFSGLKLPDTEHSWVNTSMNLQDCRGKCLNNCSCMAYTSYDIRNGGSGCAMWFGDLHDMRQSLFGQDVYVRMSASDSEAKAVVNLPPQKEGRTKANVKMMVIIGTVIAICFGMLILGCYIHKSRSRLREKRENVANDYEEHDEEDDLDLPLIDLTTIANATNNFSTDNKLGEGGFGPVYKGILMDGKEIAVKRLSKSSGQGMKEFKNEVILIAKLQHRNLVKLLGCCIQGDEKMLIYEYMPNRSLDTFIFDETRSKLLDWSRRFSIVGGIARGLLYLHQDSRLRIIHRDLKSSNVLLDKDMNPKISDFGMAKTFGGNQTEGNTSRVVGTYGYMAPEYASDGVFSVKSDVFSFGVLLLEIISGKKSRGLYNRTRGLNLIGHAWNLWNEGKPLELVDPIIEEGCNASEVNRCIQISLLCVQQHPQERPSMASVVMMLGSESALPQPKQPGFSRDKYPVGSESSSSKVESSSTNEMSTSLLVAR